MKPDEIDESLDLSEVLSRVRRGILQTVGLALICAGFASIVTIAAQHISSAVTTARISFSFPGWKEISILMAQNSSQTTFGVRTLSNQRCTN